MRVQLRENQMVRNPDANFVKILSDPKSVCGLNRVGESWHKDILEVGMKLNFIIYCLTQRFKNGCVLEQKFWFGGKQVNPLSPSGWNFLFLSLSSRNKNLNAVKSFQKNPGSSSSELPGEFTLEVRSTRQFTSSDTS